jgi:hypothetical protein
MYQLRHLFALQAIAAVGVVVFIKLGPGHFIAYLFGCLWLLLSTFAYRRHRVVVLGILLLAPHIAAVVGFLCFSDHPIRDRVLMTYGTFLFGLIATWVTALMLLAFKPVNRPTASKLEM